MKATVLKNIDNIYMSTGQTTEGGRREGEPVNNMEVAYVTQTPTGRHDSFSSATSGTGEYNAVAAAAAVAAATNMASLIEQNIWSNDNSAATTPSHPVIHPLDSMLNSWDPNSFSTAANLKTEDWDLAVIHQQQQESSFMDSSTPKQSNYTVSNMTPQTSPVRNYSNYATATATATGTARLSMNNFSYSISSTPPLALSTPNSGLVTPPMTSHFTPCTSLPKNGTSSNSTTSSKNNTEQRGSSVETTQNHHYGKRASSQPSVASVVSLTAHEPVSKIIDGIEYITFLYSHDRLVKEYTVRTDVDHVAIDAITVDFRIQNAIYPRANVNRSDYDGNRWDYETTCNQLGWKLCWLNKEQLFGRRGLIQRAVDSYRNRHAEMRSRRVTRQEKVANGTLRKRRSKKSVANHLL